MRCKTCNYALWQIRGRTCPECGSAFKPSDFQFVINSVRFCCPHCAQEYYGTDANGHLVPKEFTCVRCQQPVSMDEMVLLPSEGVSEALTEGDRMPWLDDAERTGLFRRWMKTVWRALIMPNRLMAAMPEKSPAWSAARFAVLSQLAVGIGSMGMCLVFLIPAAFGAATGGGFGAVGPMAVMFGVGMGSVLGFALVLWLSMVLGGHAILRMTGPTERGLRGTYEAVCYSSGANVASALPCLGYYVGWIWWVVSAAVMVSVRQKVSGLRAAAAMVGPPLAVIALIVGGYFAVVFWAMSSFGQSRFMSSSANSGTMMQVSSLGSVRSALLTKTPTPTHGAELIGAPGVQATEFIDWTDMRNGGPAARMRAARVGALSLTDFASATSSEQAQALGAAKLPANVVAHRLGDCVFVHHGIDLSRNNDPAAGKLWLIVMCGQGSGTRQAVIVTLDGTSITHASSGTAARTFLKKELAEQNVLRARWGLPPIPDPRMVTEASPGVAGSPVVMNKDPLPETASPASEDSSDEGEMPETPEPAEPE